MTGITTTVTWKDLQSNIESELGKLRDAYDELSELAIDEYGEDWQSRSTDDSTLEAYQEQALQYEQAAESMQKRQHLLTQLPDEYGDGDFEVAMLSGEETMKIETELRMLAQSEDTSMDVIQVRRNALTVDAATVDAPEGVPRDDNGSPVPSECPNALTLALWEQVEAYNNSGETDFQPTGFGDTKASTPNVSSETPSDSETLSTPSAPTDNE